jgi:enoyl-CoA hydratase/carnithine racemase
MLAFTKIGLMPDGGASLLVPAAVGRARAARMALLAEKIPAAQAAEWGLVSHPVADEEFAAEVDRVVGALAAAAPLALARTKQAANASTVAQMRAILGLEAAGQESLMYTEDFAEGVAAFQGKRTATFHGR